MNKIIKFFLILLFISNLFIYKISVNNIRSFIDNNKKNQSNKLFIDFIKSNIPNNELNNISIIENNINIDNIKIQEYLNDNNFFTKPFILNFSKDFLFKIFIILTISLHSILNIIMNIVVLFAYKQYVNYVGLIIFLINLLIYFLFYSIQKYSIALQIFFYNVNNYRIQIINFIQCFSTNILAILIKKIFFTPKKRAYDPTCFELFVNLFTIIYGIIYLFISLIFGNIIFYHLLLNSVGVFHNNNSPSPFEKLFIKYYSIGTIFYYKNTNITQKNILEASKLLHILNTKNLKFFNNYKKIKIVKDEINNNDRLDQLMKSIEDKRKEKRIIAIIFNDQDKEFINYLIQNNFNTKDNNFHLL